MVFDNACKMMKRGEYQDAIDEFEFFRESPYNVNDPHALYNIACCYSRLLNLPKALEYLEHAVNNRLAKMTQVDHKYILKDPDMNALLQTTEEPVATGLKNLLATVKDAAVKGLGLE